MSTYRTPHCAAVMGSFGCNFLIAWLLIWTVSHVGQAAVAPNNLSDQCGPYYIWYQTGPDSYSRPTDFVDLYSIAFDISDVVDDFDFVYFTDHRAELDIDQDGISDQHFSRITGNQIIWRPTNRRVRIMQQGCWSSAFSKNCGYAMISIQPKAWFKNGSARIPIHVTKKCSPTGTDCSETHIFVHEYTECPVASLPEFTIHKQIDDTKTTIEAGRYTFLYHIMVENTTDQPKSVLLEDSVSGGTNSGRMILSYFDIECPDGATCTVKSMSNDRFQLSLANITPHTEVVISYKMGVARDEIPQGEVSYFTNTATLSTGSSTKYTVSVSGTGGEPSGEPDRRPERPRQ